MIGHSPNAPVNEFAPEPPGICDRCDFKYPLSRLNYQMVWAGDALLNTRMRVCPTCMDEPQQNGRRTLVIGPDPKPVYDPRPYRYGAQAGVVRTFILDNSVQGVLGGNSLGGTQFVLDDPESGELNSNELG